MNTENRHTPEYYAKWLKMHFPGLLHLFDFGSNAVNYSLLERYLSTASHGERLIAEFAISIWLGDNSMNFDFVDAAKSLNIESRQVIADFLLDPFWP